MLEALLLLVAAGGFAGLWSWAMTGRELVLAQAERLCRELGFQTLDGNAVLRALQVRRQWGRLRLVRVYRFEFTSDGRQRHAGDLALAGNDPWWAVLHAPDGAIHMDLERRPPPLRVIPPT